ncbi:hypothetical protein ACTXNA_07215 [Psychrobacter celer]|uniref:phage tail tube protein n=1 Tax=Psychrobacter celer TaxID=306572 RepID=UPI003FCF5926
MSYEFLSLQGATHLARNIDGQAKILRELGNQTQLKLSIESDKMEKYETKTGKRQKVFEMTKTRGVNLEMVLDEQKREDIALAFQAQMNSTQAESVADSIIGDTLEVGDVVKLDGFNLTDITLTDNADTPAVLGQHYEVDAKYGTIKILDLDTLVQPLKASYMTGETETTVLFTLPDDAEYYMLFEGINSTNDKRLALELWRFKPEVQGEMDFINEETGEISINGSALADPQKNNDPKLGGFGRIVYLDK